MVLIFDTIHGYVPFSNKDLKFLDNRWVKRLKRIKQLGLLEHVFPCASHNRFEHSVGVAYLAEKYCNLLNSKNNLKKISEKDIRCIKLAGLFHDLGHGPFSHIFDNVVLKKCGIQGNLVLHEYRSKHIVNEIFTELGDCSGLNGYDLNKIQQFIEPDNISYIMDQDKYLLNIINNKKTGIDVDKFDYLLRDPKHIGLDYSFDPTRIMLKSSIYESDIVYDKSLASNIYDMFHTRYRFHKDIYNHKTVKVIELMIGDALVKANNKYNFGSMLGTTEFLSLDDSIYSNILFSDDKDLKCSKNIIERIENRRLYKQLYSGIIESFDDWNENQFIEDNFADYNRDNIRVVKMTLNLCNGKKNPLENIIFKDKNGVIDDGKSINIPKFDTACFEENTILVYDINK